MKHADDNDPVGVDLVVHAVWEAKNRSASQSFVDQNSKIRPILKFRKRGINRCQKLFAKSWQPALVPGGGFAQIILRRRSDD